MDNGGLYILITQHIIGLFALGPCTALVMRMSLVSRSRGVITVLGAVFGSFFIKSVSVLGLSFVLIKYPVLFYIFKIFGSAYLISLGLMCFFNSYKVFVIAFVRKQLCIEDNIVFKRSPFLAGFLVSITNPLSSLRFIALFATILTPQMTLAIQISYLVILAVISLVFYISLALFFSTRVIQIVIIKYRYILDVILGCTLIYWGIKIFRLSL